MRSEVPEEPAVMPVCVLLIEALTGNRRTTDPLKIPVRGDLMVKQKQGDIPAIWVHGDGKLMFSVSQADRTVTQTYSGRHKDRGVRQRSNDPQEVRIPGHRIRNLPEIQAAGIPRAVLPGAGQTFSGLLPAVHRGIQVPAVQAVPVSAAARISAAQEGDDRSPLLTGITSQD
jgi:hypothetical protein